MLIVSKYRQLKWRGAKQMSDAIMKLIDICFLISLPLLAYALYDAVYMKRLNTKKVMKQIGLSGDYFIAKTTNNLPGYHKTLVYTSISNGKREAIEEIDIIYVHETGVYVFELKHKIGWIIGNESGGKWINGYDDGQKTRFYNPIKQNKGHIKALKSLLPDVQKNQFKSMIVFSEQSELKEITIDSPNTFVFNRNELERIMKEDTKISTAVLTKEQIDEIYNVIKPYSKISEDIEEKHIEQIQNHK